MLQTLFLKIIGFVAGIFVTLFPFLTPSQIVYQSVSSTTPIANTEISTTTSPSIQKSATSTLATTTATKKLVPTPPQKIVAVTPPVVNTPTPTLTQAQISALFDQINTLTRATLVNILCTTPSGPLSAISGSGVIISADGVIVTNAHVGQFLLLKDFNGKKNYVQCTIRMGSPAYPVYLAELVYIPPLWVQNNSKVLVETDPTGTGEYDYAFLKIISKVDGTPITATLPYMPISLDENINKGDNMLLDSYPAEFLGGIDIEKDLYQTTAITQVSKVFTFNTTSIDVISVPGTVVSQKGSSGGAAVNQKGELAGIITTSSDADTTGARDLRAITLTYINRDLTANGATNLKYILENSQSVSDAFNKTIAPTLTKILTDAILNK